MRTELWRTGRSDMRSYTADGQPVCFLYPPDGFGWDRVPVYGDNCRERAQNLCNLLNDLGLDIRSVAAARIVHEALRIAAGEKPLREDYS